MNAGRLPVAGRLDSARIAAATMALLAPFIAATPSTADPMLTISDGGTAGTNQLWLVEVAPDQRLFSTNAADAVGGSLAIELSFEVENGALIGASENNTDWPYELVGFNPFTVEISKGVAVDPTAGTIFAALGSQFLTIDHLSAEGRVAVLTIETQGTSSTTLNWGGHTAFAGMENEYTGSRIAQSGSVFTDYVGSLTLGASVDQDGDGDVDGADFLQIQRVDPTLIPNWEAEFGTGGFGALSSAVTSVPEPSTLSLLPIALALTALNRWLGLANSKN